MISWGSFVIGFAFGGILFFLLGIILGSLVQMTRQPKSDLTQLLHEAAASLPNGDIISMTIGRDVSVPLDDDGPTPYDDPNEAWKNN